MFLTRLVIFAVLCHQNILSARKIQCDFTDSDCLLQSVKRIHVDIVNGDGGEVQSSDPMHLVYFESNQDNLNYKANNTDVTGLRNCVPEKVEIDVKDIITYKYVLECEHLILVGQYVAKGNIESIYVEGNGEFQVDYYSYALIMTGELYSYTASDGNIHYANKNLHVDTEARGRVVYEIKNLIDGEKDKSAAANAYLNDNWQTIDKLLRYPVFKILMGKFMNNVNDYFRKIPLERALYSVQ